MTNKGAGLWPWGLDNWWGSVVVGVTLRGKRGQEDCSAVSVPWRRLAFRGGGGRVGFPGLRLFGSEGIWMSLGDPVEPYGRDCADDAERLAELVGQCEDLLDEINARIAATEGVRLHPPRVDFDHPSLDEAQDVGVHAGEKLAEFREAVEQLVDALHTAGDKLGADNDDAAREARDRQ